MAADEGSAGWGARDFVAMTVVAATGGLMRLIRVADPSKLVFDEVYYAKDACRYVNMSSALCGTDIEQTAVHPPLGKWLIAAAIRVAGYHSLGWRLAAVIAGTLSIALLYVLARKLLNSTVAATFASALLAFDFLHFVQSRVAMLDIFAALFGLAAFTALAFDRDALLRVPAAEKGTGRRPWRVAAGVAAGAATASKWSGALVALAVLLLASTWEVAVRRRDGEGDSLRRALRDEGGSLLLWLVVVPAAVYVASYAGRLDGSWSVAPWAEGAWPRVFVERQIYMADFHFDLAATHSYQSPPWSWILLKRPVAYHFTTAPNGDYKEIFAAGSPLVWWSSIVALVWVATIWALRRDPWNPAGFILGGFVLTYGPWLALLSARPAAFLFYLLPAVPFMCLALAYPLATPSSARLRRVAAAVFAAGAVGLFAFYYPLLANVGIPFDDYQNRLWIFTHCTKPEGVPVTSTSTVTTGGTTRLSTEVTNSSDDLPPTGWCWR